MNIAQGHPNDRRARSLCRWIATVGLVAAAGCTASTDTTEPGGTTVTETDVTTSTTDRSTVAVNGTTLALERRGSGRPLLVIHGGGENAVMHALQAEHLAAPASR
jgi:hypothetical protein